MEVYVLRHAIAVERGHPDYSGNDSARPLTAKGIGKMRRGAEGIRALGLDFDLILSSPYRRARETAEIVADAIDQRGRLEIFAGLAAEVPATAAIREVSARVAGADSVLLVGHEPQLSEIASILLAGNSSVDFVLKKAGMYKLECSSLSPGTAAMEWWLTPRQLRRLGG